MTGFLLGWRYALLIAQRIPERLNPERIDDFVTWAILGVIIGGRLGYVMFYHPSYFLASPIEILFIWQGGMAFHGGLLGVVVVMIVFCRRHKISFLVLSDVIACVCPIGIFFGRVANFINGELYGYPSRVPWAMIFPEGGPEPRHPSQLYEALLEGLVLLIVLGIAARYRGILHRSGMLTGMFLVGYALARSFAELFRDQSVLTCCFANTVTTGQLLSFPMFLGGLWLLWWTRNLRHDV